MLRLPIVASVLASALGFGALGGGATPAAAAPSQITGTVFEDFNSNGVQDTASTISNSGSGTIGVAVDRGIPGVAVTAFDNAGANVGSAVSGLDGTYAINIAVPNDGPYRVEFSNLPAGYQPSFAGPDERTSVQFVPDGNTAGVNLGILLPADYCQDNPTLATCYYHFGNMNNGVNSGQATLVSFPYSAGATGVLVPPFSQPAPTTEALANQIGTTWGLAYSRSRRVIYAASYMKKHTSFGAGADTIPNTADDAGAIYAVNPATNAVVNVFTVPGATTNPHVIADTEFITDNFDLAFDATGKVSLGAITLSSDESRLFAMNLENRTLYALNASTGVVEASAPVPLTPPGCPATGDVRPFAVEVNRGTGYIGMVCSAESTPGTPANLQAYVYTFDQTTLAYSPAPVFQTALNYPRGRANAGPGQLAPWNPWVATFTGVGWVLTEGGVERTYATYPQPMFTSIAFDPAGNMKIGLRDRYGDQMGVEALSNPVPTTPPTLYSGIGAGDTLLACGSPTIGWTLESNGVCNAFDGTGPVDNGQGPGNSEFFWGDAWPNFPIPAPGFDANGHDEVFVGGLLQIPGFPDLVSTTFTPIPLDGDQGTAYDGGLRWFSNTEGSLTKAYRVYDGTFAGGNLFAKASGVGDLVALCDEAPIEIGNRVWIDTNNNGRQDPNEAPLPNVTVGLYSAGGVLLDSTSTSINGTYYFRSVNGGVLQPNTGYQVRIDTTQPVLAGYQLTLQNSAASGADVTNNAITDVRDSDAAQVGSFATIPYTTGGPGNNNHGLDFGFFQPVPRYDLGDNPDTGPGTGPGNYNTLLNDNGPRHLIIPGLYMGALVDDEPDGQPSVLANGDDINPPQQPDDEDGVVVSDLTLQVGANANVRVNATNTTGSLGTVCGYIDFNGDGDFLDAGEGVSVQVPTGSNNVQFILPFGLVPVGSAVLTYARFRLAINIEACSPVGTVQSGEVEDYRVEITNVPPPVYDLGDNPDTGPGTGPGNYNTLLNDNGPQHRIIPGLFMGAIVDAEPDGQPNVPATGDDINPPTAPDDEDGVIVADLTLTQTLPANVRVNATNTTGTVATLCGFMDWNGDGDFLDAGETATVVVATGSNNVQYILAFGNVPLGAAASTYARFRLANGTETCTPVGTVQSGEVEDYRVSIAPPPPEVQYDLGDNPQTRVGTGPGNYNTKLDNNGARHLIIPGLYMGTLVDAEQDGQPNVPSDGDDINPVGGRDDEDGVRVTDLGSGNLIVGSPGNVRVTATNTAGQPALLCGFIDWNADGDYGDANERASVPVPNGSNAVEFILAFGIVPVRPPNLDTYSRFRLTLTEQMSTCTWVGTVQSGEVEDYVVPRPTAITLVAFSAQQQGNGVNVSWRTGSERDSYGFFLWRSSTGERGDAVKVNAELIAAKGQNGGGAAYSFVDPNGKPGDRYWLQEQELSGALLEYGSVVAAAATSSAPVVPPVAAPGAPPAAAQPVGPQPIAPQPVAPQPIVAQVNAESQPVNNVPAPQPPVQGQPVVIAQPVAAAPVAQAAPANVEPVAAPAAAPAQPVAQPAADVAAPAQAAPAQPVAAVAPARVEAKAAVREQEVAGAKRGVGVLHGERSQTAVRPIESVEAQPQPANTLPGAGIGIAVIALGLIGAMGAIAIRRRKLNG